MKIKDNEFRRQFETLSDDGQLISIEYSYQERKIFLTKIQLPHHFDDEEFINNFLKKILKISEQKKLKVVPIHPRVNSFFKKNPVYKQLLPPGIKI